MRTWVTWTMIGVFAALFLMMEKAGGSTTGRVLMQFGAVYPGLTLGPQPWRLVSAGLLHIGILHLLMNAWALWALGRPMETRYGALSFWAVFVLSVVGGSLTSAVIGRGGAGASGGIFGLMALYVVFYFRHRKMMDPAARSGMERWLMSLVVMNVIVGVSVPNIAHEAHLGGFVVGVVCGVVLRPKDAAGNVQRAIGVVVLAASVVAQLFAAVHCAHIARHPYDYPTREWREPETGAVLRVPVWLHYEKSQVWHAFRGEGVALGMRVLPVERGWEEAVKEGAGLKSARSKQEGRWLTVRGTVEGDDAEMWFTVVEDRLINVMLRATGREFDDMRSPFAKFAESLTLK